MARIFIVVVFDGLARLRGRVVHRHDEAELWVRPLEVDAKGVGVVRVGGYAWKWLVIVGISHPLSVLTERGGVFFPPDDVVFEDARKWIADFGVGHALPCVDKVCGGDGAAFGIWKADIV